LKFAAAATNTKDVDFGYAFRPWQRKRYQRKIKLREWLKQIVE